MRRVVVDTNVWVSALLNPAGSPAQVPQALQARRFSLVVCEPLLAELAEVLRRPRIVRKYGVTEADIRELMALLRARGQVVPVTGACGCAATRTTTWWSRPRCEAAPIPW